MAFGFGFGFSGGAGGRGGLYNGPNDPNWQSEQWARFGQNLTLAMQMAQERQLLDQKQANEQVSEYLRAVGEAPGVASTPYATAMEQRFGSSHPMVPAINAAMRERAQYASAIKGSWSSFTSAVDQARAAQADIKSRTDQMPDQVSMPNLDDVFAGTGGPRWDSFPNKEKQDLLAKLDVSPWQAAYNGLSADQQAHVQMFAKSNKLNLPIEELGVAQGLPKGAMGDQMRAILVAHGYKSLPEFRRKDPSGYENAIFGVTKEQPTGAQLDLLDQHFTQASDLQDHADTLHRAYASQVTEPDAEKRIRLTHQLRLGEIGAHLAGTERLMKLRAQQAGGGGMDLAQFIADASRTNAAAAAAALKQWSAHGGIDPATGKPSAVRPPAPPVYQPLDKAAAAQLQTEILATMAAMPDRVDSNAAIDAAGSITHQVQDSIAKDKTLTPQTAMRSALGHWHENLIAASGGEQGRNGGANKQRTEAAVRAAIERYNAILKRGYSPARALATINGSKLPATLADQYKQVTGTGKLGKGAFAGPGASPGGDPLSDPFLANLLAGAGMPAETAAPAGEE